MVKLYIEEKVYELPTSMNEMTTDQLISLSQLVSEALPIQEIKVKMLFVCLGARARRMKNPGYFRVKIGNDTFAFTTDELTQVSAAFDFLFTKPDDKGNCFLDNKLTVNHFPVITVDYVKFESPKDAMTDMIYNQYIYLQTYDVMQKNKPNAIYAWLGCMFRRNKAVFDPEDLNIELMKKIRPEVIVLTLWYWIGSCRFIADKFPRIFSGDGEEMAGNPYDGQQKLLDFIAKGDPDKKRSYKKDMLYDILYSLDYLLEKNESEQSDLP